MPSFSDCSRCSSSAASVMAIAPILIIVGIMLQSGLALASVKLVAIMLFLLLTGPTASNALASAALLSGYKAGGLAASAEDAEK